MSCPAPTLAIALATLIPQDSSFVPDNALSIFWWHPRPMDYRRELFRLVQARHRPRFFFLADNPACPVDNASFSRKGAARVSLLPRAMTWRDARTVWSEATRADVFVTSFLGNAYTVFGAIAARSAGKPVVIWEESRPFADSVTGRLRRLLWRLLARLGDSYFVLGDAHRRVLRDLGVEDERIFVANEYPGAVYARVPERRVSLRVADHERMVLFVGRFIEIKGIRHLLHAFAQVQRRIPDTTLVLAGDGPQKREMEALARELRLQRVHFIGYVSDEGEKSFLFRRADLLVVPSVRDRTGSEGGPLVVLEAMSAGLQVLGTDALGSSTALIVEGQSGKVVPDRDPRALAEATIDLLQLPIDRKRVLGHFASIPDHRHQAEQMERAIAFARARAKARARRNG